MAPERALRGSKREGNNSPSGCYALAGIAEKPYFPVCLVSRVTFFDGPPVQEKSNRLDHARRDLTVARLNTFPVSVKVAGRRIVIVGGDEEALAKARLAAKTSAEVVLFSEHFEADFSRLDVALYRRPVEVADFANAALAFIADHGAEGARAL